jgi:catechol 2,3-dioxygenase-like lactoylglutathione lyase family enzyme
MNALSRIRQIDYTIIFCRDLKAMKRFYGEVLGFPHDRDLFPTWIEFRVGSNILALTQPGGQFHEAPPPHGALSLQLAFRVAPDEVNSVQLNWRRRALPWKCRLPTSPSSIARCSSATLTAIF